MAKGDTQILYAKADGTTMQQNLADIEEAKRMSAVLQWHYPNHSWAVNVDSSQGIATIKNFRLSGNWGFLMKLKTFFSASEIDRQVVMAAGELLERYNLSRGAFRQHELDSLKANSMGELEFCG